MSPLVGLLQLRYNSPNNYLSKHTHFKWIYIMVLHTDQKKRSSFTLRWTLLVLFHLSTFTVSDDQFWRVTVPDSCCIGHACHAADGVRARVFMCMFVAVLWRVAGRLRLLCYSKQGVYSHSSSQSFSKAICQLSPTGTKL